MSFRLSELGIGEYAEIFSLQCGDTVRFRLMDIGMAEKEPVCCLMQSLGGGISAYRVGDCVIAVRREDADNIYVKNVKRCSDVKAQEYFRQ